MASSVTLTEPDRFTVAGLLRRPGGPATNRRDAGAGRGTSHLGRRVRNCLFAWRKQRSGTGLGAGDRIAFLDRNGIAYFDVLFGGALIGAVNVAVNGRLAPKGEMAAIIDDSTASVLVIHADYLPALADMKSGLPAVDRIVVIGGTELTSTDARIVCFDAWIEEAPLRIPGTSEDPTR